MTQKQPLAHFKVLRDIGQSIEDRCEHSDRERRERFGKILEDSIGQVTQKENTVHFEIVTDIAQNLENTNGQRDTEPRDGKL